MKWKILIFIMFLLVFVSIVFACKESYYYGEDDIEIFDSIEDYGINANCNLSIYNETDVVYQNLSMEQYGFLYNYSLGKTDLPIGTYRAKIECHKSNSDNLNCTDVYLGECNFVVIENVDLQYYLYLSAILIFFILLGLSYWLEEPIFAILSGMISIVIAVYLFVEGFPQLSNDFLKNGVVVVLVGIGMYLVIAPSLDWLERWF